MFDVDWNEIDVCKNMYMHFFLILPWKGMCAYQCTYDDDVDVVNLICVCVWTQLDISRLYGDQSDYTLDMY